MGYGGIRGGVGVSGGPLATTRQLYGCIPMGRNTKRGLQRMACNFLFAVVESQK